MRQYAIENGNVRFWLDDNSRERKYRPRWSNVWDAPSNLRLPFRVANYFYPTQLYTLMQGHLRHCSTGKSVVVRGVWRNRLRQILST